MASEAATDRLQQLRTDDSRQAKIERLNASIEDFRERFIRYSNIMNPQVAGGIDAVATLMYHRLEKGMSLRHPRPGFGLKSIDELLRLLDSGRLSAPVAATGASVVADYAAFQEKLGYRFEPAMARRIADFLARHPEATPSKETEETREKYFSKCGFGFDAFAATRHCVRYFTDEEIPVSDLLDAITVANTAPSACNRQPTRVHLIASHSQMRTLLRSHRGGNTFADEGDKLLILTGRLPTLVREEEYSGLWLDAGAFLMNLCYALHERRIAHCILNLHLLVPDELEFRRVAGIPEDEVLVCMLLCGRAPEAFRRPSSPRMPAELICTIHQ